MTNLLRKRIGTITTYLEKRPDGATFEQIRSFTGIPRSVLYAILAEHFCREGNRREIGTYKLHQEKTLISASDSSEFKEPAKNYWEHL